MIRYHIHIVCRGNLFVGVTLQNHYVIFVHYTLNTLRGYPSQVLHGYKLLEACYIRERKKLHCLPVPLGNKTFSNLPPAQTRQAVIDRSIIESYGQRIP